MCLRANRRRCCSAPAGLVYFYCFLRVSSLVPLLVGHGVGGLGSGGWRPRSAPSSCAWTGTRCRPTRARASAASRAGARARPFGGLTARRRRRAAIAPRSAARAGCAARRGARSEAAGRSCRICTRRRPSSRRRCGSGYASTGQGRGRRRAGRGRLPAGTHGGCRCRARRC
jgi:hypothetical protein